MSVRRRWRGTHGQALVEFALTGLVLFVLILGTIDIGRAAWHYNTLAHATREGARYAIVHGASSPDPSGPGSSSYTPPDSDTKITQQVEQFADGLDFSQLTVHSEWLDDTNEISARVKVTSQYTYEPMFDLFGIVSFNMSSSSTMEITH